MIFFFPFITFLVVQLIFLQFFLLCIFYINFPQMCGQMVRKAFYFEIFSTLRCRSEWKYELAHFFYDWNGFFFLGNK